MYVLDRSIATFSTDLRVLAALVNFVRDEGLVGMLEVKSKADDEDHFVEQEIEAMKIVCGETVSCHIRSSF